MRFVLRFLLPAPALRVLRIIGTRRRVLLAPERLRLSTRQGLRDVAIVCCAKRRSGKPASIV